MTDENLDSEIKVLSPDECPVRNLRRMDEVLKVVRSKPILNPPEGFAASSTDPENAAVNVQEFLRGTVMFTDGGAHRDRRKMLNQLVSPDAVNAIREDILLPAADTLLERMAGTTDPDGVRRMDLVEFLERVFLHFTAKLVGLEGIDTDEGLTRLRQCAGPLAAGSSSGFLQDRPAILVKALEAKRRYVEEFYLPSRRSMADMLAKLAAGKRGEGEVPWNILRFIVSGADPVYADETAAINETTLMLAASVGTSTQSVIHTMTFLREWFKAHPEDFDRRTDLSFLLNALQETIRLRAPFSPYTTRVAGEDAELGDEHLRRGQEIHIEWVAANRDKTVFGEDANDFNPNRPSPTVGGLQRYGVGFGSGAHQCFGLRVVLGTDGAGGAHTSLLQKLFRIGVEPDPDRPAEGLKLNASKFSIEEIPRYIRFPVVINSWSPPANG